MIYLDWDWDFQKGKSELVKDDDVYCILFQLKLKQLNHNTQQFPTLPKLYISTTYYALCTTLWCWQNNWGKIEYMILCGYFCVEHNSSSSKIIQRNDFPNFWCTNLMSPVSYSNTKKYNSTKRGYIIWVGLYYITQLINKLCNFWGPEHPFS